MTGNNFSRRDFLKLSAATAGGIALAGCASALTPTAAALKATSAPAVAAATLANVTNQDYVWLCAVTSLAFWLDGRKGMTAAGKALGVKTEFLGPQAYDAAAHTGWKPSPGTERDSTAYGSMINGESVLFGAMAAPMTLKL